MLSLWSGPKLNLRSISPTFYKQLLRAQISNVQKDTVIFVLLGSGWEKAVCKTLVKLTPDAIVVKVVEDGQAELISLTVVRLGSSMTEKR